MREPLFEWKLLHGKPSPAGRHLPQTCSPETRGPGHILPSCLWPSHFKLSFDFSHIHHVWVSRAPSPLEHRLCLGPARAASRAPCHPTPSSRSAAATPCRSKEGDVQRAAVEGEQTATGMQKETVSKSRGLHAEQLRKGRPFCR